MEVKTVCAVQITYWANGLGHNVEAGFMFLVCNQVLFFHKNTKKQKTSREIKYSLEVKLDYSEMPHESESFYRRDLWVQSILFT